MGSRYLAILLIAFSALHTGRAQSIVSTVLGGVSDGVQASLATLNIPCSVVADQNGNVYVGLKGNHQVVRIDKSGLVWMVAGSGATGASGDGGPAKLAALTTPAGLALDSTGNLYIADSDSNRIRRVGTDGVISTFAGNGKVGKSGDGGLATAASLASPSALAFDPSGDLVIADTGNNEIRMVTPGGSISTIAGNGTKGTSGNGIAATQAQLNAPAGVAVDSAGNIYIADTHSAEIRKVTSGIITRYGGLDANTTAGTDTTLALNTILTLPTSLALDSSGNLYFVEYGLARVRRIGTDGKIGPYAGTGFPGSSGDGGWARYANLNVLGIAMDPQNNLLIADGTTYRVRIVTAANGFIDALAGNGWGAYTPRALAVDGKNNVYFSDGSAQRVRKLNMATGEVTLVAGNGVAGYDGDGGAATAATLNGPRGLAFDGSGNLYIADSVNNVIRRVSSSGVITTVVGNGTASSAGDGLAAISASIHQPSAVAFDSAGNLFIAEQLGHYIRKVTPSGTISTVAGTGAGGSPDAETGIATSQRLNGPQGLAMEPAGTLLIADSGNNRIRRLATDGTITTVAGTTSAGTAGDGGQATSAQLWGPTGVSEDSAGNIYIADTGNSTVRRIGADGIITTIGGTGVRGFTGDGSPATAYRFYSPAAVVPVAACSLAVADTLNLRIRQLSPAVDYTISSNPPGLLVAVDGQAAAKTPFVVSLLPGTQHSLAAVAQSGPAGTRYAPLSASPFTVDCGPARSTATMSFLTQYLLTVLSDDGANASGWVSSDPLPWMAAGSVETLQASAASGYVFGGWQGDCTGTGACQVLMNGPKTVKAVFIPSQVQKGVISSGGVVGGGMSTPPVTAISPGGVAAIFGASFAPAGTFAVAGSQRLVNGQVPTDVDGVCVLVGSTKAPVLALTPAQINFQVPQVTAPATLPVQVVTGCGTSQETRSDAVMTTVQSAAPEFFYFLSTAGGQAPIAARNTDTGVFVGSPGMAPGNTFAPAKPGDTVTLYATGLGATNPSYAAGVLPDGEGPITGNFWVSVGGVTLDPADVQYAGVSLGNAGVYEVRIHLPAATPDGNQPVQISVNGFVSPATGYITVQH